MRKILSVLMMVLLSILVLVSCDNSPKDKTMYTITFDQNKGKGGTTSMEVEEGGKLTNVVAPTKSGCTFAGWKKSDGTSFDIENTTISENLTLIASWSYNTYVAGSTGPAGGIIFYDAGSEQTTTYKDSEGNDVTYTWRYLEVAPITAAGTGILFGYYRDNLNNNVQVVSDNTENIKVGSGHANTRALVNAMKDVAYRTYASDNTSATDNYAAKKCEDYGNGTEYDDWFLPSKGELQELFNVKDKISSLTTYANYWSSSESEAEKAYYIKTSDSSWNTSYKSEDLYRALPIRAF